MSKAKENCYFIVNGIKIYENDYLANNELSETDLDNLFLHNSLTYSLVFNMLRFAGCKQSASSIIKEITADNSWLYKYKWTYRQQEEYEDMLSKIFYNVYRYRGDELKSYVQWFIITFGLQVVEKS